MSRRKEVRRMNVVELRYLAATGDGKLWRLFNDLAGLALQHKGCLSLEAGLRLVGQSTQADNFASQAKALLAAYHKTKGEIDQLLAAEEQTANFSINDLLKIL